MDASGAGVAAVVSPNAADVDLAVTLLRQSGIDARGFHALLQAAATLDDATGCLVIVEEALVLEGVSALREALGRMPAWCDVPLVLVARDAGPLGDFATQAFPSSHKVTLLERPLNPHTLVSAVQVALRASARQRQVGELLAQRERAVRQRDEFLAVLAHELRNPLAPMRNALYLLRTLRSDDPRVQRNIAILERQIDHVVRMVDDLMDVARLERGKVILKPQRVDLNRVIEAAVESCHQLANERGHRVVVRVAPQPVPVDADPMRIEQVVCNLVNNAAKFSPDPGEIVVSTSLDGDRAQIVVEDRGVGFGPEEAAALFDPFVQVNPTLERASGGLGMGLTIVKRLVELHGGTVHGASDGPGKGARFVVHLPLAHGGVPADRERAPAREAGSRKRVVVVEDNPDIRETMRMLLELWGHEVALAPDGVTGLRLVLEMRPDVALVDVGLPGMNGYDVAAAIRAALPGTAIRLVAVSGYGLPSDVERALRAGFDTHLLKPIAPEALEGLLAA